MADPVALHLANLQRYERIKNNYSDGVRLSERMIRVFYSHRSRAFTSRFINAGVIPHPKAQIATDIPSDRLKQAFAETRLVFQLSDRPYQNPPIQSLRITKACRTVFIDLSGSYISRTDPFRKLARFSSLKYLSLHDCGLMEIPADLVALPKTIEHLDLSSNYIAVIPENVQWSGIKGLNLADNAFLEWPSLITQDGLADLEFLSLAGNAINVAPDRSAPFRKLRLLDLSNTQIPAPPGWLVGSDRLRVLRLNGATGCVDFPHRYLMQFPDLKFVDITGVRVVGKPIACGEKVDLFVRIGEDPAAVVEGSYARIFE
jgi:hypothetical protein